MLINTAAYLDRIGFAGRPSADLPTLCGIHWAHLRAVPFENLDIRPLGLPISLNPADLEEKIVRRRRGGFCYELNGLLAEVLVALGFGVTRVSSRFMLETGELTPPFDHMALLVRTTGSLQRYFVDVGCARSSPAFPLLFTEEQEEEQIETGNGYRFVRVENEWRLDMREPGSDWKIQHLVSETPRELDDFTDRCRFQWNDPESHFTQRPLCSINIPGGRITLTDSSLIRTERAVRTEEPIADPAAFSNALRDHFGITL